MMTDEAVGRILGEIGAVRGELAAMREQSDSRHRTLASEMLEVRAVVARAEATANEAKRIAEGSAYDTDKLHRAVAEHTKGLATRVEAVEKSNDAQNVKLDVLVAAAHEQKIREDERLTIDAAKWKTLDRWKQIGSWAWPILAGAAGYLCSHWRP